MKAASGTSKSVVSKKQKSVKQTGPGQHKQMTYEDIQYWVKEY